jgi:pilus assembly protein CpaB
MNWKTWVPLVLAIVLGVAAAKVARDTIMKSKASAGPVGKYTKIVVAKTDITPGTELKPEDLAVADVQMDLAPTVSFKTVDELAGRSAEMMIVKGQPVAEVMLTQKGSGSGLQALVPNGMRAITMEVNEFSGVAGLLTPGCHVDILATINDGGSSAGQLAKTIVQNVQVKAVGQRTTVNGNEPPNPNEMFRSVTVLASLADAEAIELACSTGRPRLVLRGGRDNAVVASAGVSLGELRGGSGEKTPAVTGPATQPAVAVAPATQPAAVTVAHRDPPGRVVKLIKGGVESSVTLKDLDGTPSDSMGDTDSRDPFGNN